MASASFVEIISHFAGYLRIFHDIARDRVHYDESLAPDRDADYTTPRPAYDHRFVPDDMETAGSPVGGLVPDDIMDLVRGRPLKLLRDAQDHDSDFLPSLPRGIVPPPPVGGGGGGIEHHIRVKYEDGGAETQLTVHQHNFMHDDDTNLSPDALAFVEPLIARLNSDILATVEQLVANSSAEIPANWVITPTDAGATEFAATHDAAWLDRGGTPDQYSVPAGYYVNGEPQERPAEPTPPAEVLPLPDTGHGIGQWAALGGNQSLNAALVVDIGEGVRTMVVMGDYYKTDAMFQTNTIVDHDRISVSGGDGDPSISRGDNATTNIADFAHYASIYDGFQAYPVGSNWIVDVVDGNYYSVHAVLQTNYLSDNDVATQVSSDSHYNLVGGHNLLGNLALIVDGVIQYDLIIIQGAYHGMNVIFQNNVLLNNDRIVMSADGADPSQSVNSANNDLSNKGLIENYGGDDFRDMTPGIKIIEDLLAAGVTSIDPELGSALVGNGGGALRVLYVTGDYYDINAVWQTNVTSDVNVLYQLQNQPPSDLLALHPDATLTQSATTGGNELTNEAAIVDVNPDVTYVGGQVYTDSILVQADLVPVDQDHAVKADTDALVTELVAFVDDAQEETCAPPPAVTASVQADPIACVLH